jgi:hypothetical protein
MEWYWSKNYYLQAKRCEREQIDFVRTIVYPATRLEEKTEILTQDQPHNTGEKP